MKKHNRYTLPIICIVSLFCITACTSSYTSSSGHLDILPTSNEANSTTKNTSSANKEESTQEASNEESSKEEISKEETSKEKTTKNDDTNTEATTEKQTENATTNTTTHSGNTTAGDGLEEVHKKYQEYLEPADDEVDFMFASDYEFLNLIKVYRCYDSCSYETILGIKDKVTIEDIKSVLKTNKNISQEYKDFIIQYVEDWLALYPDSDFRLFYHNLKTLQIKVCTEDEIMVTTLSTGSAACYVRDENTIYLLEGSDFSRESDNYIILTHELTHCARSAMFKNADGYEISVDYHEKYNMGTYAEEGIITDIVYEMQGLNKRADFYPFQSSCYRIIMDCTGYDGSDFMNHSVNYLMKKMDDYMGDEQYAYYIIALIDSISIKKYESYKTVDFTNYQDLCDYMTKMYMKKYLKADMSNAEAEQVFDDFCANIMHNFEIMNRKYDITRDNFVPAFEQCKTALGIK